MVAERIFCPFSVGGSLFILSNVSLSFCQLFLSPSSGAFLSIGYFSFLVVEGCVCFLFTAHFYPRAHLGASTTWNTRLLPISYVRSALSARSIRDFRPGSGFIGCGREVKRKIPVSFTPNSVNHNFLLHPCEG